MKKGIIIISILLFFFPLVFNASNELDLVLETEVSEKNISKDKTYDIPLLGNISAKNVSLPLLTLVLGLVDGFNPCAMWILVFLITMLIGLKDRKKMWLLGSTFILTSGIIYLLFMVSWLSLASFLGKVVWIRLGLSAFAIIFGMINIYNFLKEKDDDVGCSVTNQEQRKKIMAKIRKIIAEKKIIFQILGIIVLAASVNILELLCSLGLPVIFTEVLAFNNLSTLEYIIYLIIYIFFFLLDDMLVFGIAMKTMSIKGISSKYTKYSHLIGGLIMLIIGLLMVFKPEWLMFNF